MKRDRQPHNHSHANLRVREKLPDNWKRRLSPEHVYVTTRRGRTVAGSFKASWVELTNANGGLPMVLVCDG